MDETQNRMKKMSSRREHMTRYCFSGLSCMCAAFITNPIDVIKVRLQLDNQLSNNKNIFANRYYKGFVRGAIVIVKDEGIAGLYKGVTASLMRDGIYGAFRIGAYEPVKGLLGASGPHSPLWKKIMAGATTGAVGSALVNPTDLVKIRMQGQKKLQPGEERRYKNTFSAFRAIFQLEGVRGLWRGVGATVQRAAVLTAAQVSSYDHTKSVLLRNELFVEGRPVQMSSALIAGFVTAFATNPIDVIKTRIMNETIGSKNKSKQSLVYSSTLPCLKKIYKSEGILGFYKGFIPNWLRLGPHTMITFLIFEQLRKLAGMKPV